MAYVVKHWEASNTPNQNGEFVNIKGRQEGWISWILSFVGVDPTIHMVVTQKNFLLEARTFWGYARRSIPISRISEDQGFRQKVSIEFLWFNGDAPLFDQRCSRQALQVRHHFSFR